LSPCIADLFFKCRAFELNKKAISGYSSPANFGLPMPDIPLLSAGLVGLSSDSSSLRVAANKSLLYLPWNGMCASLTRMVSSLFLALILSLDSTNGENISEGSGYCASSS